MPQRPTDPEGLLVEASRALSRLEGHEQVLQAMALRRPLAEVLERLVRTIERASPNTFGSVLLLDDSGTRVLTGAAPSLPRAFSEAINGEPIGPVAGTCGTAAWRRERVIVSDIATDPLWADYKALALAHGLRSSWSTPIVAGDGRVLGTFAQYSGEVRAPTEAELQVLDDARDLASVAIQLSLSERNLQRVTEALQAAQRVEAVGRLAGGVAHDFNNLLTVIRGSHALARQAFASGGGAGEPALLLEALEEAEAATDRAMTLARQLLTFSRHDPMLPEEVDLRTVITELAPALHLTLGERHTLTVQLADVPCRVNVDRAQIAQVMQALLANARAAMRDGGTVEVTVTPAPRGKEPTSTTSGELAAGVQLQVTDSGHGMDEATRTRVFEPTVSAKATGLGLGLGLPTVHAIAVRHGGYARIDSAPDAGCTVTLWFPAVAPRTVRTPPDGVAAQKKPAVSAAVPLASPTARTVLLAEDEDAVRRLVARLLVRQGFVVHEAHDGEDALAVWRAHEGQFTALVTDVMMPRLGGTALAEQLRAEQPALPVLFCSGYADTFDFDMTHQPARTRFLAKPFAPAALLEALEELTA